MPEYFYHIGLELFDQVATTPINVSRAFQILKPFASRQPRASRDTLFDRKRTEHIPSIAEQTVRSTRSDHRLDKIFIDSVDMEQHDIATGIGSSVTGAQTKASFEAISEYSGQGELGIIHLYRDVDETLGLYKKSSDTISSDLWNGSASVQTARRSSRVMQPPRDEECRTLCILAVPSYLTPKDFLAFVGDDTRAAVQHFRMVKTQRLNRYMVLMKFNDGRFARQWQHDWNGKVFNTMEPETCHVVFVKSVEVMPNFGTDTVEDDIQSISSIGGTIAPALLDPTASKVTATALTKPIPPPTPALVELPTCPVCLERMDETTGLLTILCQHVFHCTCLEKWSGGGCPVCRYTYDDFSNALNISKRTKSKKFLGSNGEYELDDEPAECEVCRLTQELWQCLICGYVGCGRYAGKHAYVHYEKTGHTFALDLDSKRVWDYDRDVYVHRIIADGSSATGEKLLEIPGRRRDGYAPALEDVDQDIDMAKRDNLAFEYTQLLTSQLESQRVYFEEVVSRAVDKATEASKRADKAVEDAYMAKTQLERMNQQQHEMQLKFSDIERESSRLKSRGHKLEELNRELNKRYLEEKAFSDNVSYRAKDLEESISKNKDSQLIQQQAKIQKLEEDNATKDLLMEALQEEHRDLRFRLDAEKKLREMVERGELDQAELEGATIEVGPAAAGRGRQQQKSSNKKLDGQASQSTSTAATTDVSALEKLLGNGEFKIGDAWDVSIAAQLLLEKGLLERREEEGLYDDEDTVDEAKKPSGKKKKNKKKKKRPAAGAGSMAEPAAAAEHAPDL